MRQLTKANFPLFAKSGKWYNVGMEENQYWKVCEALDNEKRMELMRYLLADRKEFPCVVEIAEKFGLGLAATSTYLKKLLDAGLVSSKRDERRVYYRAYATTAEGERTVSSLRRFFEAKPSHGRILQVEKYIRALSHCRRHAIVRLLNESPGMDVAEIGRRTDMPRATVDRILSQLDKAKIVDLNRNVCRPNSQPEETLLEMTLA